jgi:hypothetical protein
LQVVEIVCPEAYKQQGPTAICRKVALQVDGTGERSDWRPTEMGKTFQKSGFKDSKTGPMGTRRCVIRSTVFDARMG